VWAERKRGDVQEQVGRSRYGNGDDQHEIQRSHLMPALGASTALVLMKKIKTTMCCTPFSADDLFR
jgi:uncharacterized membrane protein YjdF